jgi:ATP-binding cassette subfamily B protein
MRIMESALDIQDLRVLGSSSTTAMSSMTNDIAMIEKYIFESLRTYLPMPFLLVFLYYYTFAISPMVGTILLVTMVIISVLTLLFSRRIHHLYSEQLQALDRVNTLLREKITGSRTIRAYDSRDYEVERFGEASSRLGSANRKILLNSYFMPHLSTAFMWMFILFIFLDSILQGTGEVVPEEIILFMQYATYMVATLSIIPYLSVELPRTRICLDRVWATISAGKSARTREYVRGDADKSSPMLEAKGLVTLDARGNRILNGLDIEIRRGETVTLLGMNGNGAAELFNTVMGFSTPADGSLRVAGLEIGKVDPAEIRSMVSYASNGMNILRGTLRYNLDPNGSHSDDEILSVCGRLGLMRFIEGLPEGLDHTVVDDSSSMSGGQRLQVILARALLHDSDMYVFDDCFFSLDSASKETALAAITDICRGRTVVFVMHDVSTCPVSDRIILMDRGSVLDIGSHDELLSRSGLYSDLYSVGQRRNGTWA